MRRSTETPLRHQAFLAAVRISISFFITSDRLPVHSAVPRAYQDRYHPAQVDYIPFELPAQVLLHGGKGNYLAPNLAATSPAVAGVAKR